MQVFDLRAPTAGPSPGAASPAGPDLPGMRPHSASHLSVSIISRSRGHSAVAAAAYRSRGVVHDCRTGLTHDYRRAGGLLSHEVFGWKGSVESLWNAAETAEKHPRACVARELLVALPAELDLDDQVRLVRGMSCWLRDTYGVAVQSNIHAPRFRDRRLGRRLEASPGEREWDAYLAALRDPARSNRNFHAHVLYTSRTVDAETGAFGPKTRVMDDPKTGPQEVRRIRAEWEKRVNALLAKRGIEARVELRSHVDMIASGQAPEGLVAQQHLGPKAGALGRRDVEKKGQDKTRAGRGRQERQENNDALWGCWEQIRALERRKASLEEALNLARDREEGRRREQEQERARLAAAKSDAEAAEILVWSAHVHALRPEDAQAAAMRWAERSATAMPSEPEFEEEIDLETWIPPEPDDGPRMAIRVKRPSADQRVRRRGD